MKHEVSRITHLELPNKEHIVASATLILRVKVSYVEHEVERVLEIYRECTQAEHLTQGKAPQCLARQRRPPREVYSSR